MNERTTKLLNLITISFFYQLFFVLVMNEYSRFALFDSFSKEH